jgi:Xaa-Pro aminopeptidase
LETAAEVNTKDQGEVNPKALFQDRWARLQSAMSDEALDALIVGARGSIGSFGNVVYLCGYVALLRVSYSVLPASGEPTLYLQSESDRSAALDRGIVDDVRSTGEMEVVRGEIPASRAIVDQVKALRPKRVGIVGMGQVIPVADYLYFQRELPGVELVDASNLFAGVKRCKTDEDARLAGKAFALAKRAFDSVPDLMEPGVRCQEIVAELERVLRADSATDTILFVDSRPTFTRRVTNTVLGRGDLVMVLIEFANTDGYFVEQGQLYSLGAPGPEAVNVATACYDALGAIRDQIAPGVPTSQVAATEDEVAERYGVTMSLSLGHGIGVDHDLPVLYGSDAGTCERGDIISVHPYYTHAASGTFGGVADGFYVTDGGAKSLSGMSYELTVVEAE